MDQPKFITNLLTRIQQTPERDNLIKMLQSAKLVRKVIMNDTGMFSSLQLQETIETIESEEPPNNPNQPNFEIPTLISLKPIRTFREITPPAANFLYRIKKVIPHSSNNSEPEKVEFKLIEFDSALAQYQSIELIKKYLKNKLQDVLVI